MTDSMSNIVLALVDILTDVFGGILTWLLVGALGFVVDLYRRFRKLRSDVDELDRYLTGDDRDPDAPGLLEKVDKVDTEVCGLRDDMEEQHRETEQKLDELLQSDRERGR